MEVNNVEFITPDCGEPDAEGHKAYDCVYVLQAHSRYYQDVGANGETGLRMKLANLV